MKGVYIYILSSIVYFSLEKKVLFHFKILDLSYL